MARPNWVGVPVDPGSGSVLEDGVAVGIEGEGNAAAPEQVLHQQEVVVAVFMPVGGRDAPGVACADTHQLGRLIQCNLLR